MSYWGNQSVLVTGGAGFIGSRLVYHLSQAGAQVKVLDNLRTGYAWRLKGLDIDWIHGDVRDPVARARALRDVDTVFHLAALVSVPESVEHPQLCQNINVAATRELAHEAAAAGATRLVFSSSAAVYGERPENPKQEDLPPDLHSPYAESKWQGECLLHEAVTDIFSTASLRYFNVFGPGQDPQGAYAAAVPAFFARAKAGQPLLVHGDGGQTRDFVHVEDVVAANLHVAQHPELDQVYNVACGDSLTIRELAETIRDAVAPDLPIEYGPERAGDIRHSCADISRIRATGWAPKVDRFAGLKALAELPDAGFRPGED